MGERERSGKKRGKAIEGERASEDIEREREVGKREGKGFKDKGKVNIEREREREGGVLLREGVGDRG